MKEIKKPLPEVAAVELLKSNQFPNGFSILTNVERGQ